MEFESFGIIVKNVRIVAIEICAQKIKVEEL